MTGHLAALGAVYRNDRSLATRALASNLAEAGIANFPLRPGKKTPATLRGFKDASAVWHELDSLYSSNKMGIGVVPGCIGAVVIDIDVKRGHQGPASFEALVGHSPDQAALVVSSPSGGYHLWYATPHAGLGSAADMADGIDYRSWKGYVAMHPGYTVVRWDTSQGLPPLPQALRALMLSEKPVYIPAPPPAYGVTEPAAEPQTDYSHGVDDMLGCIPPDVGNDEWVKVCFAVAAALPAESAEATLIEWSRSAASFDPESVRRIRNMVDAHNKSDPYAKRSLRRLSALAAAHGWAAPATASAEYEWDDSDAPEEFWEEAGVDDTPPAASPAPETRSKAETWGQGIEVAIEDDWWESDPVLQQIREGARAMRCAPAAVLGAVLTRVSASIPHWVCVTAFRDGTPQHSQLNFFTLLVGGPGQSKTISLSAAKQLMSNANRFPEKDGVQPSSGEGILEAFMGEASEVNPDTGKKVKVRKQVAKSVLIQVDEAMQLFATAERSGSITMHILKAAWSGHTLATHTGGAKNTREVLANEYRLSAIIGAQPVTLGTLLNDKETGTIQRFTCFPASDPTIPDVKPAYPGELYLNWQDNCPYPPKGGKPFLVLPTRRIVEEIDRCRVAAMRGTPPPAEYNLEHIDHGEHTMLLRLRVAALWAALTRPTAWWNGLTNNDWDMAFQILMISTATQRATRKVAADHSAKLAREARHSHARRELCADRVKNEDLAERQMAAIDRGISLVANKLKRVGEPLARKDMKSALNSSVKREWRAAKGEGALIAHILDMGHGEGLFHKAQDGKYILN